MPSLANGNRWKKALPLRELVQQVVEPPGGTAASPLNEVAEKQCQSGTDKCQAQQNRQCVFHERPPVVWVYEISHTLIQPNKLTNQIDSLACCCGHI